MMLVTTFVQIPTYLSDPTSPCLATGYNARSLLQIGTAA